MTDTPALRVLSNGVGVQSTTIALLIAEGTLPTPDAAIFADTGWEPRYVYEHLERVEEVLAGAGVACYRVSKGNLRDDHLDPAAPFTSMPLFVRGQDDREAMGRRQCTNEYKLVPVRQKTRELLGYVHPTPVPRGVYAETWVGFSTDEIRRVNPDRSPKYARLTYPLLDLNMSRKDCRRFLELRGWTVAKSACIGCPFHGNAAWRDLRDNRPDEWADAVDFDERIRNAPQGSRSGMRNEQFLHRSLLPLSVANIDRRTRRENVEAQTDIFDQLHALDLEEIDEHGDPDGCGPYSCRSGEPVE